jgi:hypothetical protein
MAQWQFSSREKEIFSNSGVAVNPKVNFSALIISALHFGDVPLFRYLTLYHKQNPNKLQAFSISLSKATRQIGIGTSNNVPPL